MLPKKLTFIFASLRAKLFLLVLMVFIPALCLNLYFAWEIRLSSHARALKEAQAMAKLASDTYTEEVEGTKQLLMAVSKISRIRVGDDARCYQLLSELLTDTASRYLNLLLIDQEGRVICRGQEFLSSGLIDHLPIVEKVKESKKLVISAYPLDEAHERVSMIFAYPILNFSGQIGGAIAAVLDDEWLNRFENDVPLPAESALFIFDKEGDLFRKHTKKEYLSKLPESDVLKAFVLEQKSGVVKAPSQDGVVRFFALMPLVKNNKDFFLCMALPVNLVFANADQIFLTSLMLLLCVGGGALLAAWGVTKRMILEPLNALVLVTQSLAEGRLSQRTNFDIKIRELAQLAYAFDRMAESLEQREIALKQSRKKLADILAIAQEAIISLDEAFIIRFFNPAAQKIFGYSAEETIGQRLEILLPQEQRDKVQKLLQRFAFSSEVILKAEEGLEGLRKNGGVFPAEALISKLELNQEVLYTAIIKDVTTSKKIAEARERWSAELARSNEELERFAYNASHDLQEPLRMVASYVQLLQERYSSKLDEKANEYISYALDGALRLQKMIRDLLAYARAGRPGAVVRPIECQKLVDQTLADFKGAIAHKNATVVCHPLPTIMGDETEFRQLIQNLLSNALKFHGEAAPYIEISAEDRDTDWLFSVRDNGIGIDPRFSERIFGLFQRLHTQDRYEGTGIGLALCRKIVENYGGKMWVTSTPGRGSCFYFSLLKNPHTLERSFGL